MEVGGKMADNFIGIVNYPLCSNSSNPSDIETLKTKVQTLESNMTSVLEKLASFVITANAAATNTKLKLDNKADGTDPSVTAYKEV